MKPEDKARADIDRQLEAAGWRVQDYKSLNLGASLGVAAREFPMQTGAADYVLLVDRKAVGVVEAKPEGTTLSGVAEQSGKYLGRLPPNIPHVAEPLPFSYESTGVETFFRDVRDPGFRSRRVFSFHRPETLLEWANEADTLRARLRAMPPLATAGLRDCQVEAVTSLERSFAESRPRALIQMASGAGKTFTAVNFAYRLIKYAKARRVLFLVDRSHLGRQTNREFSDYATPDDGRKFTELYNVQHLRSNHIDKVSRVCISTIQRIYSMLKGEELAPELEEGSFFEQGLELGPLREVAYNPEVPIETFDFIITDECHRSIYNLWRQVLEYYDAFIVGLTATPSKQTLGFFNQNLVTEYGHERAVADGVNAGYEVYRIRTGITEKGGKVEAGNYVDRRDKKTRRVRWEALDEDLEYEARELDRSVVALDQIRTVIRTFRDRLFTEIFPGRTEIPKTLVFAKDDSHAEDIVGIIREEFGRGNEFCKKITYKTTGEKPEDILASLRNDYNPRIAVTVDMIATGTDVKPLECLIFMRDIRSRVYFEQMKGRGTRVTREAEFRSVTPDAKNKTHFVIVDAVGVCESDKSDSRPLERKKSVPFDKLLLSVALGVRDEDTVISLAGRLARLEREIGDEERSEIEAAAGGRELKQMTRGLLDCIDPDAAEEAARKRFGAPSPTARQIAEARKELVAGACAPFDDPKLRETLVRVKKLAEQVIDTVSQDEVLSAGFDGSAKEKAKGKIESFRRFMEDNRDELTALQIIYNLPSGRRRLTYEAIREVADAIRMPPYNLTPEELWRAYEILDRSRVRGMGPQKLLTNVVSLLRFAVGRDDELRPFPELIELRYQMWLDDQRAAGREFTAEQLAWLGMIRDHIAASLTMEVEDFRHPPFHDRGGAFRAKEVFGGELEKIVAEMNEVLVA